MNYDELWKRHCSFFEKDFKEQLEYNKQMMKKHIETWSRTVNAKTICKDRELTGIKDIPITNYGDYRVLSKFGEKILEKEKSEPRKGNELWYDYYSRILNYTSDVVDGYLPDKTQTCVKTTGTTGVSKWIAHGEKFNDHMVADTTAIVLMALATEGGKNLFDNKPNALNLSAPVPYLNGWMIRYWETLVNFIPPVEVTDSISDFGKKFYLSLKSIENGNKISLAGGSGALLYMACKYFLDPEYFLEETSKMTSSKTKKALIFLKLMSTKLKGKRHGSLQDTLPLKGVVIGSTDARVYADFFREEFGIEPLNAYAASEIGCAMFGRPDRKLDFFPNLRSVYHEFLDDNGEIKSLNELEKSKVYELIATPFHSMFVRYRIEDLFRVVDFYDGIPLFTFEGRKQGTLEVNNYFRFSEDLMAKVIVDAGFRANDRWTVTKTLKPKELLYVLFENEWPMNERQAEKLIFNSALSLIPGFQDYVRDFRVEDPADAIKVEYLQRGTFTRYAIRQARKNVPLGQYKPLKIIPADKLHILEELKECSRRE